MDRRRRWLRRAALALRVAVGTLTLGVFVIAGVLAARVFGRDSPLVWSTALVAGLAAGVLFMGRPELHRLAGRLEQIAEREAARAGNADARDA